MHHWKYAHIALLLPIAFLCAAIPPPAVAQETPTPLLEKSQIESRLKQAEENESLEPETKATVLDVLRRALEQANLDESWRAKIEEFSKALADAPVQIEALQEQLSSPLPSLPDNLNMAELSLEELTQLNTQLEQQLAASRDDLARLEKEVSQRVERRRLLPELQSAAFTRLQEARAARDTEALSDKPELAEAQQLLHRARIQAIENEISSYNIESQGFETRGRLRNLRIDAATRLATQFENDLKNLQGILTAKRREDAARAAQEARITLLEAGNAPPQIRALAEELAAQIADFAEERISKDGILNKIESINRDLKLIETDMAEVETEFSKARHRVDVAERSAVVGTMLRTQKAKLPNTYEYRRKLRQYESDLAETQFKILDAEEKRRELNDIDGVIRGVLLGAAPQASDEQRESLNKLLFDLYQSKRDALERRLNDLESYSEKLMDAQGDIRQLLTATERFRTFIDERILWAKSGAFLHPSDVMETYKTALWFGDLGNAAEAFNSLRKDAQTNALLYAFTAFLLLSLLSQQPRLLRTLKDNAELAQKGTCTTLKPTIKAVLATALYPTVFPAALAFVGWRLNISIDATDYGRALGVGMLSTAVLWWALNATRAVLAPHGLGPGHFDWAEQPCAGIARILRYARPIMLLFLFAIMAIQTQQIIDWHETTGRAIYVVAMCCLVYAVDKLIKQRGGPLLDLIDMRRGKGHLTMRRYWRILTMLALLILIGLAATGYYYTALQFTLNIGKTLIAALVALLVAELILRWAMISRRRLTIEQRKKRLSDSSIGAQEDEEYKKSLAIADKQTSRMVWISYFFVVLLLIGVIWNDMFPAIRFLDAVKLSEYTTEVTYESPDPATEGGTIFETVKVQQHLTLRHVVIAIICGLLTMIVMRNLPGFLEIAILQSTKLGPGERYAIRAIVSYIILFIGVFVVFNNLGLQWSQLQWLVAALGVGLGFGLQEIFANFVSGLVILFERPIRVGDTVTVGGVSGTVSKIRIRATHITAFNRQELIVPNKEFVTGQLINWDLTDHVLRVEIPVGIAYGSDTDKARQIMIDVARNTPFAMSEPPPQVLFMNFGENTLDFEMRVFSPSVEFLLIIRDHVLTNLEKAFREAGIEIAFPQRDLHIRSVETEILEKLAKQFGKEKD